MANAFRMPETKLIRKICAETRSVGEIINELTLNGETLEDKVDQLVDQIDDLETKLDEADVAEKVEAVPGFVRVSSKSSD